MKYHRTYERVIENCDNQLSVCLNYGKYTVQLVKKVSCV